MPKDVRNRRGWAAGTRLLLIDTEDGVLIMSTDEPFTYLRKRKRATVDEFLAEKHEWARQGE